MLIGYQSRTGSRRDSGRGRGIPRHEKAKTKTKDQKRRSGGNYVLEENHVPTSEEVSNRTLNRLRSLGSQRFALSPFSEHFGRWLMNLRDVLSEFESSPATSVDEEFVKERSQILSNVEIQLEERRREEGSLERAIKSLSDSKILLERIEEEHSTSAKEIEERKNNEVKCLSGSIDGLREELNRIAEMKTGIFRGISKKAKAEKEAEATERLNTAQRELASAEEHFTAEQERLRNEYERRKRPVIEQIQGLQKEIDSLEIDASLEVRRATCEALFNAVNALLQRNGFSLRSTDS